MDNTNPIMPQFVLFGEIVGLCVQVLLSNPSRGCLMGAKHTNAIFIIE
jgi:hypothetical protein